MHIQNFVVSGPKFAGLFSANAGKIVVDALVFAILDISIRSGDRSLKLSKVDPNFAHFWPPNFFGEGPQIWGPTL